MVKQSEIVKYLESNIGNAFNPDGAYGAQCVDLILQVYKKFFKHWTNGNANQY